MIDEMFTCDCFCVRVVCRLCIFLLLEEIVNKSLRFTLFHFSSIFVYAHSFAAAAVVVCVSYCFST